MAAPFKKTSARHLQPRVDVKVTPDTLYWKNLDVCIFIILYLLVYVPILITYRINTDLLLTCLKLAWISFIYKVCIFYDKTFSIYTCTLYQNVYRIAVLCVFFYRFVWITVNS